MKSIPSWKKGSMPRGSPTYGFNCGVIAKANNKTVGNVQHHLQFNFFILFFKNNHRNTFAGKYFSSMREGQRNYAKPFKDDVTKTIHDMMVLIKVQL